MCNGLCNKVQYVKQLLYQSELDVLFLQETEIPRVFDHSLLDIDGYVTEYCVSTEKIRTVVYIKNDIAYERRMEKVDTNVLMLDLGNKYDFEQLAGVYRPFKMMANINRLSHFKIQIKELTDFKNTKKIYWYVGTLTSITTRKTCRIMLKADCTKNGLKQPLHLIWFRQ